MFESPKAAAAPKDEVHFAVLAPEQIGELEKPAEQGGAIIGGQFDETGFGDETAELDEMVGALAAVQNPRPLVGTRDDPLTAMDPGQHPFELKVQIGQIAFDSQRSFSCATFGEKRRRPPDARPPSDQDP